MNATGADPIAETVRLVIRHQWDGRTFAAAVRAWERLRGVEAPEAVRRAAIAIGWRRPEAAPAEVASILHRWADVMGNVR